MYRIPDRLQEHVALRLENTGIETLRCWVTGNGYSALSHRPVALSQDSKGWNFSLTDLPASDALLCRAHYTSAGGLAVSLWNINDLRTNSVRISRQSAFLEGALSILLVLFGITLWKGLPTISVEHRLQGAFMSIFRPKAFGLTLLWQPILEIRGTETRLFAEALLRVRHPNGNISSAKTVLRQSQKKGWSKDLDLWVLRETLDFLNRNLSRLDLLECVEVNVLPASLNDDNYLEQAITLFRQYSRAARKVCLEITEVGTINNPLKIGQFFDSLRHMGVRLALDDFGSGNSNFQTALTLQTDLIKIDGSIIQRLTTHEESRAIVKSIVYLSKELNCKTVAEHIEDVDTLIRLIEMGVDYAQGFLISHACNPLQFLDIKEVFDMVDSAEVRQLLAPA
ncbi:MAG: EAL domain-containing protein [Limnobacter sp.]|nr:EAL domain-containing protein [Limnobacter sp.]